MKILLTADWHLKAKHKFSKLIDDKLWDRMCQEKLNTLNKIVTYANKSDVGLVVIAGDVFDTSNPPEALKAELCKILNKFEKPVIIITGRPGDHDYVSENNYVLMDLKEAYGENSKVTIIGSNQYSIPGLLICHLMLEGINDMYKKTVPLSDPMFKDYNTILLGDYHNFYHKKFGGKDFIYPGTPYPTRYGENCHSIAVVEVGELSGKLISAKKLDLKTYKLIELHELEQPPESDVSYVVKYKLVTKSDKLAKLIRDLEHHRDELIENDSNCMDVVWEITTGKLGDAKVQDASTTLFDVCDEFIVSQGGEHSGKLQKIFSQLYKEQV